MPHYSNAPIPGAAITADTLAVRRVTAEPPAHNFSVNKKKRCNGTAAYINASGHYSK